MNQSAGPLHLLLSVGDRPSLVIVFCSAAFLSSAIAQVTPELPAFDLSTPQSNATNAPEELPPMTSPVPAPAPRLAGTSQLAGPPPVAVLPAQPLLQWGPVAFRPHVFYSLTYGNGLQGSPGQQGNTLVNEVDPGMLLQLGSHWTLDYTPTLRYYSSRLFQDTFDNRVVLTGGTAYRDWALGLSQSYASSSQPLVETASQLDQETYSTALTASYRMSTALSLELAVNQNFQFLGQNAAAIGQLTDWRSWSTLDWLNYQFWPNLGTAIGAGFEYDDVSVGPNMTSEQIEGRITWKVGNKVNLMLSGGLQDRQFLSSTVPDSLTPVFSLTASYQLFEPTALSVSASRVVSPAYFANQTTESTSISAGVSQRLLRRYLLNVTGVYGRTTYQNTMAAPGPSIASNLDSTSVNVSLSTTFLKRATVSIFYQLAYYSSASTIYNYSTTQGGLSLGYRF